MLQFRQNTPTIKSLKGLMMTDFIIFYA